MIELQTVFHPTLKLPLHLPSPLVSEWASESSWSLNIFCLKHRGNAKHLLDQASLLPHMPVTFWGEEWVHVLVSGCVGVGVLVCVCEKMASNQINLKTRLPFFLFVQICISD